MPATTIEHVLETLNRGGWNVRSSYKKCGVTPSGIRIARAELLEGRLVLHLDTVPKFSHSMALRADDAFQLTGEVTPHEITITCNKRVTQQRKAAEGGGMYETVRMLGQVSFEHFATIATNRAAQQQRQQAERDERVREFFARQQVAIGDATIKDFLPGEQGLTVVTSDGNQLTFGLAFDENKQPYLRVEGSRGETINLTTGRPPQP